MAVFNMYLVHPTLIYFRFLWNIFGFLRSERQSSTHAQKHHAKLCFLGGHNDGDLKNKILRKSFSEDFSTLLIRRLSRGLFLNNIRCNKWQI